MIFFELSRHMHLHKEGTIWAKGLEIRRICKMPNSYILTETCLGVVPAVEMALQDVNDWPDILPGYKLHMQMKDSQVF